MLVLHDLSLYVLKRDRFKTFIFMSLSYMAFICKHGCQTWQHVAVFTITMTQLPIFQFLHLVIDVILMQYFSCFRSICYLAPVKFFH